MTRFPRAFQNTVAKTMVTPFLSKSRLNVLVMISMVLLFTQLEGVESLNQDSFLLATLPAILISLGLWFNFANQSYNWSMDASLNYLSYRYRFIGIIFFLGGATFHCIDLLGVEKTFAWGAGMVFLGSTILTIIFWIKFAINKRFWTYFFWEILKLNSIKSILF